MTLPTRRFGLLVLSLFALMLYASAPAAANWLTRILKHADDGVPHRAGRRLTAIDEAAVHLKALPTPRRARAVAAELTDEGHWRLRNADDETFTAATPEELNRGLQVLAPLTEEAAKQVILLTGETLFKDRSKLKELPADAEFDALIDGQVVRLARRVIDGAGIYYLDTGGGLYVPIAAGRHRDGIRESVHEILWQLARPVDLPAIRVLALEPGSTTMLKRSPPASRDSSRMTVEAVDPDRLRHMFSALSGSTVVITGRVEAGSILRYRPSSGPERILSHGQLTSDARANNVNVVIVSSASARQPGTRNWLWQRVDLARQAEGKTKPNLGDLVRQLTGGAPVEARLTDQGGYTVSIVLFGLAGGGRSWTAPVSDAWRDLAPEVTGAITATGLQLHLSRRAYQNELDLRIIPGIYSGYQWAYVCFLLLGIIGLGVAREWWQRIWPLETRSDYARGMGYWAARAVRGTAFVLLFMPLVAAISAPIALVRGTWRSLVTLGTIVAYPFTRRRTA